MKATLVIVFSVFVYSTAVLVVPEDIRLSWYNLISPFENECGCESGVDPKYARRVFRNAEYPSHPCLKCYVKCIGISLNLMDSSTGDLSVEEHVRQVAGVTPEIANYCINKTNSETNWCKRAFDDYVCIVHSVSVPINDF